MHVGMHGGMFQAMARYWYDMLHQSILYTETNGMPCYAAQWYDLKQSAAQGHTTEHHHVNTIHGMTRHDTISITAIRNKYTYGCKDTQMPTNSTLGAVARGLLLAGAGGLLVAAGDDWGLLGSCGAS